MDLIKILLESCELLETDEYNRYEEKLTDGKDIDEKNRISDELSDVVYAEKYKAFKAGFYTAMELLTGGNAK